MSDVREKFLLVLAVVLCAFEAVGQARRAVVADATTHKPLASASVFDNRGRSVGVCYANGTMPYVSLWDYPITVRYLGYEERMVETMTQDTIFMNPAVTHLPEVVIESKEHKVLHMLAYVREYSTLSKYTDTVFMFREKMVNFMIPTNAKSRFKGWRTPRVLKSKSYYRFTNTAGLDSVSDRAALHFSWADWPGVRPSTPVPSRIRRVESGTDTVYGKYSPTEVWVKNDDRLLLDINVLADTTSRKWVPNFDSFFREYVDFEQFRLSYNYDNATGSTIDPVDLTGYSFNIESNGRGHEMFMFNRSDEAFSVSTYGEVYMLDKEFIKVSEAKKWVGDVSKFDAMEIFVPEQAPELQPEILSLVARVNNVDHEAVRRTMTPDQNLKGRGVARVSFGQALLSRLKNMLGISYMRGKRKNNKQWNEFKREQMKRNRSHAEEE